MDEATRLKQEVEFLRRLVEAQNATIAELIKQRTAPWSFAPFPAIPSPIPAPPFEPYVDGQGHRYPAIWHGITPAPCEKCHMAPKLEPTITWCADPVAATATATVLDYTVIGTSTTGCASLPEFVLGGPQRLPSNWRIGSTH